MLSIIGMDVEISCKTVYHITIDSVLLVVFVTKVLVKKSIYRILHSLVISNYRMFTVYHNHTDVGHNCDLLMHGLFSHSS